MASSTIVSTSMTGLQTFTLSCPNSDNYIVNVTNTLPIAQSGNVGSGAGSQPTQSSIPALVSSLVTTINHNGSAVYTSPAGAKAAYTQITCTAGDTITIVTSSSSSNDSAINAVRSLIQISEGYN